MNLTIVSLPSKKIEHVFIAISFNTVHQHQFSEVPLLKPLVNKTTTLLLKPPIFHSQPINSNVFRPGFYSQIAIKGGLSLKNQNFIYLSICTS